MRLHKGIPACSLATVLAVLMLAPVASTEATGHYNRDENGMIYDP